MQLFNKPTVALVVDRPFPRWRYAHRHALPLPGVKVKPGTQWLKPGLVGRVRHLKGEQLLRHATLRDIREK